MDKAGNLLPGSEPVRSTEGTELSALNAGGTALRDGCVPLSDSLFNETLATYLLQVPLWLGAGLAQAV
jgi:hypothetical protein